MNITSEQLCYKQSEFCAMDCNSVHNMHNDWIHKFSSINIFLVCDRLFNEFGQASLINCSDSWSWKSFIQVCGLSYSESSLRGKFSYGWYKVFAADFQPLITAQTFHGKSFKDHNVVNRNQFVRNTQYDIHISTFFDLFIRRCVNN